MSNDATSDADAMADASRRDHFADLDEKRIEELETENARLERCLSEQEERGEELRRYVQRLEGRVDGLAGKCDAFRIERDELRALLRWLREQGVAVNWYSMNWSPGLSSDKPQFEEEFLVNLREAANLDAPSAESDEPGAKGEETTSEQSERGDEMKLTRAEIDAAVKISGRMVGDWDRMRAIQREAGLYMHQRAAAAGSKEDAECWTIVAFRLEAMGEGSCESAMSWREFVAKVDMLPASDDAPSTDHTAATSEEG